MEIALEHCTLRDWTTGDAASIAQHANNREIWRNLRDRFPHPYSLANAQEWLRSVCAEQPRNGFAIEIDGCAVGGIGLQRGEDVHRLSAEIGFWLGQAFWGRGVMSEAVRAYTAFAFDRFDLERLHATVYQWNPASARVLEKAGYQRECWMRRAAFKDGQLIDVALYAVLR